MSAQDELASVLREALPDVTKIDFGPRSLDAIARTLAERLVEKLPGLTIVEPKVVRRGVSADEFG